MSREYAVGVFTDYHIRQANSGDLPLLSRWRRQPHVAKWWGDASIEPEVDKLLEPRIAMWLVELDARPIAFIQDYDVHGWQSHHFDYLPAGSRGMDLYIGDPDLVGRGHGSRLVRQHVDNLFRSGVPAVGIDPHPDNGAALQAFEKAGFAVVGGPLQTRWSFAMLMERQR